MRTDARGLEISGTSDAVGHFDRAVDDLLHFRPAMLDASNDASAADPGAPMPAALAMYLRLLSTEPADAADARRVLDEFRPAAGGRAFSPREAMHLRAAETWLSGDMHGAGRVLRHVTREHPLDVLALMVGHQLDFFTGDALSLRDRVAEVVGAWPTDHPQFGFVLGMHAFGLEEAGDYERAEETGRRAVERDARDVWAIHAVAHAFEMRGQVRQGLNYFGAREADWGDGNGLAVHNWWHRALFALDAGDLQTVRRIYDTSVHHAKSSGLALELLDASALLWRLMLDGHDEAARWRALAASWGPQVASPFYAFNDLHAVMAWAASGDLTRADALIADRERYLDEPRPGVSNYTMTSRVGLPACRAAVAFVQGRHGDVVDLLLPIRHHVNEFGGSHAQRDVLQRTLLESALRSGRRALAGALVRERLDAKPDSPFNRTREKRLAEAGAR